MTQPIDVVNQYRALTGKRVEYAKNERSAERYIRWCERNDIDPMRFMKARVYLAMEGDREVPAIGALPSKALLQEDAWLEIVDRAEGLEQDAKFTLEELGNAQVIYMASLIAATPPQEKFKEQHLDSRATCQMERQFSGGYHPHSIHCKECPRAGACAEAVNREHGFDVVMLRMQKGYIGYIVIP